MLQLQMYLALLQQMVAAEAAEVMVEHLTFLVMLVQ
jgi:hypothetical protein